MTDHDDLASRVSWIESELGELGRTASSERSVQMLRERINALAETVDGYGARLRALEKLAGGEF